VVEELGYYIINCELYHHGVKGMKWGVRRYQNKDGSLTAQGRKRYADGEMSRVGRVTLRIKNAHAIDRDMKLQRKQARLEGKEGDRAEARMKRLIDKRARLHETMKKSVSSLSQEDIQRGMKEYAIGKSVAKTLLKVGVSALGGSVITDIINNDGIRRVTEVVEQHMFSRHWNDDGTVTAAVSQCTKDFIKIGRWGIGIEGTTKRVPHYTTITSESGLRISDTYDWLDSLNFDRR
jgi:hypothetical protein